MMFSSNLWLLTSITFILLLILTASIVFAIYMGKAIAQNDFLEYKDMDEGIKIQYPSNWKASENALDDYTNIVTFYSPLENISDTFPESVGISIIPFAENITLADYNTRVAQGLSFSPETKNIESTPTMLSGNPGYRIVVSSQNDNSTQFAFEEDNSTQFAFDAMRIWTVEDNKVYSIIYSASSTTYNFYLPIVEKMIGSFEIIKDPS